MVHLDKIYTKHGDQGTTSLACGTRVSKTCLRVAVVGAIDETNCQLGMLRTAATQCDHPDVAATAGGILTHIQQDLFDIGSLLATSPSCDLATKRTLPNQCITNLEQAMDRYQQTLKPLSSFVLPGGTTLNAHAHLARATARRAERQAWELHAEAPVADTILRYLNRLSDFFFVYARWTSHQTGEPELLWEPGTSIEKTPTTRGATSNADSN